MPSKSFRKRITFAIVASVAISMVCVVLLSHSANAYIWPKNVRGYVWDNMGNPVPSTPVTINILLQSDSSTRATSSVTTNSGGFFSHSFLGSEWDPGDTIQVIATYNADQRTNSTAATVDAIQYVNVTFPYEIPEFGPSWIGLIAAGGSVAVVGIALLVFWKRK
jgi:preprotein translocase subunit SecG